MVEEIKATFNCDECALEFSEKSFLASHMDNVHGGDRGIIPAKNNEKEAKIIPANKRNIDELNITLEEENLEQILKEIQGPGNNHNAGIKKVDETEDMDTHGNVLLKYKCDICNKRVMTSRGLKSHISRMHEKSLQRIEREGNQKFSWEKCDIKRSTEVLMKSHMKAVHGYLKRSLSEIKRGPKAVVSPPSRSPPTKKIKEEDNILNEEDLEERIDKLRRPKQKKNKSQICFLIDKRR